LLKVEDLEVEVVFMICRKERKIRKMSGGGYEERRRLCFYKKKRELSHRILLL